MTAIRKKRNNQFFRVKIMTEHATYFEKADHCTFPFFEKKQIIIIVAREMEKVTICNYYMY